MHNRNHNILDTTNPLDSVRAVVECAAQTCVRTVVEYKGGLPATMHSQGLPEAVRKDLASIAPTLETNCNHHGGDTYNPATAETLMLATAEAHDE
jgi:hypothetical protein